MLFDEWVGKVAIRADGAPDIAIIDAVRESAIELCTKVKLWRDVIDEREREAEVLLSPSFQGAEVAGVLSVYLDGRILAKSESQFDEKVGVPRWFWRQTLGMVRLHPAPQGEFSLRAHVWLRPSRKADGMDDDAGRTAFDAIQHGALYRLLSVPGKPWSAGDAAAWHKAQFDEQLVALRSDAERGRVGAPLRTRASFM